MWLRCKNPLIYLEAFQKYSKSPWILQISGFSDAPFKKSKFAPLQECRMIDCRKLWAKGGDGGNGGFSFHRSRHMRHGKADGGDGGRGGDVILECSPTVWDFSSLLPHIYAKRGGNGASKNMIGTRGHDKVVLVPVGTVLHLIEGERPSVVEKVSSAPLNPWEIPTTIESDHKEMNKPEVSSNKGSKNTSSVNLECLNSSNEEKISSLEAQVTGNDVSESDKMEESEQEEQERIEYNVAELTEPGQRIIIAQGGEGGLGSFSLSKASKQSGHKMHDGLKKVDDNDVQDKNDATSSLLPGSPGSKSVLILELKSIADVGLVGMPNAGKSTLLGALSKAQPRIGNYAFTTLRPNLGNLTFDDLSITVADIPGLIKGAHENRGLGHNFLRHIERTSVLAYVLDLAAALDGRKGIPPWEQLRDLILELEFYKEGLSSRPTLIVANKIDEAGAEEVYDELRRRVCGVNIFPVCAVLREGVAELKDGLRMLINGEISNRLTLDDINVE